MAEAAAQNNWFVRQYTSFAQYLADVKVEMAKVTWPSKEQIRTYTAVVLSATIVISIAMGLFDMVVGRLVQILFQTVMV